MSATTNAVGMTPEQALRLQQAAVHEHFEGERRKRYETTKDRDAQYAIAAELSARWRCNMQDLPYSYEVDFCAVRGEKIVAFVETKVRSHTLGDYPTVLVSMKKYKALLDYERLFNVPGVLVFKFNDGLYHFRVSDFNGTPLWGGRTHDTRDKADVEPVIHIPVQLWKPVNQKGEQT